MSDAPAEPDFALSGEAGAVDPAPAPLATAESITGAKLDPVDGQPIFGPWEGVEMSRERYLAARWEQNRAALVSRLQNSQAAHDQDGDTDVVEEDEQ